MGSTNTIRALTLILIGCLAVYFALTHKRAKSVGLFFALVGPYAYFGANLGFVLTPAKLIGIVALVAISLKKHLRIYNSGSKESYFVLYFIYIAFLTVVMANFWPSFDDNSQGFFYSNTGRWGVQLFQQLFGISIVLIMVRNIKSWNDVDKLLSITLLSMLVMGIIGLYIYFAQRFGLPFPRIARAEGLGAGHEDIISTKIFDLTVVRAYSLSGEPKGLASDMVLGLTILLFVPLKNKSFLVRRLRHFPIFVLMLLTLFFTYSTAGYIMFPIAFLVSSLIVVVTRVESAKVAYTISFGITLLVIVMVSDFGTQFSQTILYRLINRVGESGLNTYAEDGIAAVWQNSPISLFFGTGLGGSNFYIRELNPYTFFGKIAAPRGIYGFLGDKGLVGLALYLFGCFICLRVIWLEIKRNAAIFELARGVFIFLVVGLLLIFTKAGWYFEWLLMGLMIACANICSGKRNTMRLKKISRAFTL